MSEPIVIRASSLSGLFDCPARWAAVNLEKKYMPRSSRAQLGTAVHASTALFDQSVLDGSGISIDDAAAAAVDEIHKPKEEVDWADEKPQDIEDIALSLHRKYCAEIAPTQIYKAVEVNCESLHIADLNITLTGTTDRIRETEPERFGIADIKTGKTAVAASGIVNTKGHGYQIGVYELLGQHASGLPITEPGQIIGLNAAKTDAAQRVGTGEIVGARDVLIGTEEMPGVLQMAAQLVHSGSFFGNPKSQLCGEKYCPIYSGCHYR